MATFSVNEDGTLNYIPEHVPYVPIGKAVGSIVSNTGGGGGGIRKKKKQNEVLFEAKRSVDIIIRKFAEYGMPISPKTVQRYLNEMSENLKDYFLQQVVEHNERMKAIPKEKRMQLAKDKLRSNNSSTKKKVSGKSQSKVIKKSSKKKLKTTKHSSTSVARIQAQLREMENKSDDLMRDIVHYVHETGISAQLGNFKISKLK